MNAPRNVWRRLAPAVAAGWLLAAPASAAQPAARPAATRPTPSLREIGDAFETGRLLAGADRLRALEEADRALTALPAGGLDDDQRFATRFLAGMIRFERGDYRAASDLLGRTADGAGGNGFAADASLAEIQALDASGDAEAAARALARWVKRYPGHPLVPEVQLAVARNALRRGKPVEADGALRTLLVQSPWMRSDQRVILAQALAFYLQARPADALARLGVRPQGDAATYLAGLCHLGLGARLKAAALFQETAERYPDSPLRDHALLAKANAFLDAGDERSAAQEFARVAERVKDPAVRAEAELRAAGALVLSGGADSALVLLRDIAARYAGGDVAARAQLLVGEVLAAQGHPAEAIIELNRVLTRYFQHRVAAGAQYRVARCLDQLGRGADATGAYQAVVSGYPLEPEAPAAAYLAGVGLMRQNRLLAAAPYFQIVLDRYAPRKAGAAGPVAFADPAHRELVEAALCMLELAYHRTGNLGQLSGAPHLLLQQLAQDQTSPSARSPWRAWALLIDADASAAQARYPEAQATLERLAREYPDQPLAASALKLLAWTYSRQGRDSMAVAVEERLLQRYATTGREAIVSAAFLDIAHERFNQKRYREAAAAYDEFVRHYPAHPRRLAALYQCGLCYLRLDRAGDAVDRWETIVRDSADAVIAERAFARMGDAYFQAERYADAKRSYRGLLEHFAGSPAAALASLRLAQCAYNAGQDAEALEGFSTTIARFPASPVAREAQRGTELALYRLSQRADGRQVLARLVEQFPGSAFAADAQYQIARRDYQEKRWNEAAEGFRRVVSGFPGYASADQAQFLLADACARAGKPDEARQAYEQFVSFFPASDLAATVEFRLGLLAFEAKDYMHAAIAFTRALDDSAGAEVRSASRYNLALCDRMLGAPDSARVELERHRREFPADARAADVAYQLGDLEESAGRTAEALSEFERALTLRPRAALEAELGYRIGRAREQLGQPEAALAAYRRASASGARDDTYRLSALARLAALYEKRKDYTRALAAYKDIARNARDHELAAAAAGRASQLEASVRR